MPTELEVWLAFRRGEHVIEPNLICCICGKEAQGNASFTEDGAEICDECCTTNEG